MENEPAGPGASDVHSLLCQIIAEHGIDVIGDRDRIRALLQESPASAPRETLALAEAAGLGIPAELRAQDAAATVPIAEVAQGLARRLQQDAGLADDVSRWAVATWAGVLGIGGVRAAAADAGPGDPGAAAGFAAPPMANTVAGPAVASFGPFWAWGSYLAWRRGSLMFAAAVIVVISLLAVLINESFNQLPGFGSLNSSLSTTCTVGRDSQGALGWIVKFTNATSSDVTVDDFTILFFNSSGTQTGSLDGVNVAIGYFTVAANNSYTASSGGFPAYSTTCRVTDLIAT